MEEESSSIVPSTYLYSVPLPVRTPVGLAQFRSLVTPEPRWSRPNRVRRKETRLSSPTPRLLWSDYSEMECPSNTSNLAQLYPFHDSRRGLTAYVIRGPVYDRHSLGLVFTIRRSKTRFTMFLSAVIMTTGY